MREEEEEEEEARSLARDPILWFRRGNAGHVNAIAPLGDLSAASNLKIRRSESKVFETRRRSSSFR